MGQQRQGLGAAHREAVEGRHMNYVIDIPQGLCQCGCGTQTKTKYVKGHASRDPLQVIYSVKKCSSCGIVKPVSDFVRRLRGGSEYINYTPSCKQCRNEKHRNWRETTDEHGVSFGLASHLKHKYGLTPREYKNMLEDQEGKCLICHAPFSDKIKPNVDHYHETGQIRGLLCTSCNIFLGYIESSENYVERALNYLGGKG